ncbi:TetR/AcrR family transcriptional regulator [Streptomyces sp. NPDC018000]|uniref:TetR/AcrR family transcriptional regulator n=1 Tax=Streptomyces sp. NPDC018000 TaxID=3365028 RepID=UPI0037993AFD
MVGVVANQRNRAVGQAVEEPGARDRLLRAGRQLFAAYGYARTSVEDLCEQAKVPVHVFQQEFVSREVLMMAIYDEVATYGLRAAENALMAEGMEDCPTSERVRLLFDAYVKAVTEDPCAARVAFVEVLGVSREMDNHLATWRAMWIDFLTSEAERAVRRGEAVARDHTVTVTVLNHSVDELMAHHGRRPRQVDAEWLTDELTRLSLAMILSS